MTREVYDTFIEEYKNVVKFSHEDLHHFLAFDSTFDDVLETLQDFFTLNLGGVVHIKDLRIP